MMEYGLFLKIANTGNNVDGGHECPIQIAAKLLKVCSGMSAKESYSDVVWQLNEMAMPDEPVLDSSAIYCGMSNALLQKDSPKPFAELAPGWSRMISKFGSRNIYIVGWDILEDDLRVLESNLRRLQLPVPDFASLKTIDVKKLAELVIPVKEVGAYGIDAVTYNLSKGMVPEFGVLLSFRSGRRHAKFCEMVLDQSFYCMSKLAKRIGVQSLDELYAFMQKPHKLEVLPFGKHKGEKFTDVFQKDHEYLCWLHSCKDIMSKSKDLKYTLDELMSV